MIVSPASCLFVLGRDTVWVMHTARRTLFVYGPGTLEQHHVFETDEALDGYQISMTERLLGDGWVLWQGNETKTTAPIRREFYQPATVETATGLNPSEDQTGNTSTLHATPVRRRR